MLTARALTAICPPNLPNPDQAELLSSGISTHDVVRILAIVGTASTGLVTSGLILMHLLRYRVPSEQRQIIRLTAVPFVYAVFTLLEICFYDAAEYLRPLADLYEAFALVFLLMLFFHLAEPQAAIRSPFTQFRSQTCSPALFQVCYLFGSPANKSLWLLTSIEQLVWLLVFQYPLVRIITTIATEASLATGKFCARSSDVQFASIWVCSSFCIQI